VRPNPVRDDALIVEEPRRARSDVIAVYRFGCRVFGDYARLNEERRGILERIAA
jgi:hypothetical protein